MQPEQQQRTPEVQRSPDTTPIPGVEANIGLQRKLTGARARVVYGAGVVLGAFLLGFLTVKLFPEFPVSRIIYAMMGQ
jgi:hypothetical protein